MTSLKADKKLLNASPQELRKFGFLSAAIIVVLFMLIVPWLFSHKMPLWPLVVGVVLVIWAGIHPASLKIIHNPWVRIGTVLGWLNSRIILGAVFYGLITPVGVFMKLVGNKLINELDVNADSYREPTKPADSKQMENPY